MAITEKSKEMLKRFLTFDFDRDFDNPDAKGKFADMFRKMLLTDDPGMKDVVKAMFDSFGKYNVNNKTMSNEEPSEEDVPEETPAPEEAPAEEPTPQEQPPQEAPAEETPPEDTASEDDVGGIFGENYGFGKSILESINDWLEV